MAVELDEDGCTEAGVEILDDVAVLDGWGLDDGGVGSCVGVLLLHAAVSAATVNAAVINALRWAAVGPSLLPE